MRGGGKRQKEDKEQEEKETPGYLLLDVLNGV